MNDDPVTSSDGLTAGVPVRPPRMEVDSYGNPPPNLQLTWFEELDPLQQYMIAKHLYQYLADMKPSDFELVVRSPRIVSSEQKESWLEFYLCQTIARTTEKFKEEILEAARAWSIHKVDYYAKEAKDRAEQVLKEITENQNFCAKAAMQRLQQEQDRQKPGQVKP